PLGYYRPNTRNCSPCALGQYQDVPNLSSCRSCGTMGGFESTTLNIASTNETDCLPKCKKGFSLNMAQRTCNKCPIGKFKDDIDLLAPCSPCPEGLTTNREGATSSTDCSFEICPKGSFRPANEQQCTVCDYGFYQQFSNATIVTSCTPCPGGNTTLVKGAASPDLCVSSCTAGSAYSVARRACVDCPIGQYRRAGINPPWCIYCSDGTTTTSTGSASCVSTPVTPAPLAKTSVVVTVVVGIGNCNNRDHIRQTIVNLVLVLMKRQRRSYPDLCPDASCLPAQVRPLPSRLYLW
ncbi:hypothetical protein EGW08_000898, partial [Elysia chlorotica]